MPASPQRIVDYLRTEADRPLKAKELAGALSIPSDDYEDFRALLDRLEEQGVLYRLKGHRYGAPEKLNLVTGRLQTIRSGAGFVVPEEGEGDLFIPSAALESALHGDRVVARVERRTRAERPEGRIIKVLERSRKTIVGVYHPKRSFGFVAPEDRRVTRDFFVPPGSEAGAVEGDVVVLRVTSWGDGRLGPAGEVDRVLGPLSAPGVDIDAVLYGHELPVEFPAEVLEAAERVAERGIRREDLERRRDFRDELVFTIDPADAKDHDDALSVSRTADGSWEVGVHIADVSFYVEEGGQLDAEAFARATSVYLVDRVVPMLPESLSAGLCSLQAGEDRLTFSVLLRLDDDGRVRGHELVRGVIRARHALSYADAQAVLEGGRSIDAETDEALRTLARLSAGLRRERHARGSIDFDLPEARVVLNTAGEPTDIQKVLRYESHRLIEDYMLAANEAVAHRALAADLPMVYRVHEAPDEERIGQVADLVATFGLRLPRGKPKPKQLQRLILAVDGRPEEGLVSTVLLRSMKQARYSAENLGHYGLAAEAYTHFTSPIRRYPDLVVHRLAARAFLDGERPAPDSVERLVETARHASARERVAVAAERDSIDLKKVQFMQRHLGDEFEGTISGVTSFGLFVLLDAYFVEGLVHVSSLDDDYYVFLEEQFALVGERRRRRFQLGDRARVQVAAANLEERKIDFLLAPAGAAEPV